MDINEFKELIQLYFADELSDSEKKEVEELVRNSAEFGEEFGRSKNFYAAIEENKPQEYSEEMLVRSRQELMRSIRKAELKPSLIERISEWFITANIAGYNFAAGTAAALVAGLVLGYFTFSPTLKSTVDNNSNGVMSIDKVLSSDANIDNVKLIESPSLEGKITITFEAAKPYTYTGSVEDKAAQMLLANMITKSDNPGVRIKSVKTLAESVDQTFKPDPDIKKALIASLKNDNNAGVRRTALDILKQYPYDDEIRDAILYSLNKDKNSGIRVAAINALAELKLDGVKLDSTVKNELSSKVKDEPNLFIKNLAESLLKGDEL